VQPGRFHVEHNEGISGDGCLSSLGYDIMCVMQTQIVDLCIPNISKKERQKRLMGGVISLALSLVVLAGLLAAGVNFWWRLLHFPLFASAASGYFQWREKT
jgi:hypothetical protein